MLNRLALLPVALASCIAGSAMASTERDVMNAHALGRAAVEVGYATSYSVGIGTVDVYADSNSATYARTIADSLCIVARRGMEFEQPFTVRVFTVDGRRPAATCSTG